MLYFRADFFELFLLFFFEELVEVFKKEGVITQRALRSLAFRSVDVSQNTN